MYLTNTDFSVIMEMHQTFEFRRKNRFFSIGIFEASTCVFAES